MIPTAPSPRAPLLPRVTPDIVQAPGAANERPSGRFFHAAPWASAGTTDARASCSEITLAQAGSSFAASVVDAGNAIEPQTDARPWIAAIGGDGRPYAGDLLADILEYRVLRSRQLCGIALDITTTVRLSTLERRLRSRPDPALSRPEARAYHRYACRFSARIVCSRASVACEVEVRDLSAGGVKIAPVPCELDAGDAVWLELGGSMMMPARVAWTRDGSAGLMFAGAPRQR